MKLDSRLCHGDAHQNPGAGRVLTALPGCDPVRRRTSPPFSLRNRNASRGRYLPLRRLRIFGSRRLYQRSRSASRGRRRPQEPVGSIRRLRNCGTSRSRALVLEGDPAHIIVQYARTINAGLIVMPTHGRGPFRRFLLGSVTAKVLHDAECPVWTGPHLEQAPAGRTPCLHRVLCAWISDLDSRGILGWAGEFAGEYAASLAVCTPSPPQSRGWAACISTPTGPFTWPRMLASASAACSTDLETGGEVSIPVGDPPHAIAETAATWKADLLVIGRGRHTGHAGPAPYERIRDSARIAVPRGRGVADCTISETLLWGGLQPAADFQSAHASASDGGRAGWSPLQA